MIRSFMLRTCAVTLLSAAASLAFVTASSAQATVGAANPTVGGAAMLPTKNIVENATQSKDHTTLVAAVKAAGLVETLSGKGPFTVFAPTNAAFEMLPKGAVDDLLKPANKAKLAKILTTHVVDKAVMADALNKLIVDDKGSHSIKTVSGSTIIAKAVGGKVTLTDENGMVATVTQADIKQSNGVVHVIDRVLTPK